MGTKTLLKRSQKTAFPNGDESCIPQRRDAGLKRQKVAGGMPHFLEEQAKQQQSLAGQVLAAAPLNPMEVAIQQAAWQISTQYSKANVRVPQSILVKLL